MSLGFGNSKDIHKMQLNKGKIYFRIGVMYELKEEPSYWNF